MSSSATRAGGAVLRRGFFVVMAFVTRGAPGAKDANAVLPAFGEHYCQEPPPNRESQQSEPHLASRVARVLNDSAEWVGKHREGLGEADAVFLAIRRILGQVPLERKCHSANYGDAACIRL